MSDASLDKPFAQELFEGLDDLKSPKPEALATDVDKFERFLTGILLPFVGVNAFVCGGLYLLSENGSKLLLLVLVAVQLLAWYMLFPLQRYRSAWLHVGGLATVILMTLLTVPNSVLAVCLGFVWSMALVFAIRRGYVREHSVILYAAYLPWLAFIELEATARVVFEMATILPMTALFVILGFRIAGGAALLTMVVVGLIESNRMDHGSTGLIVLTLLSLLLAIGYQWRLRKVQGSALKEFLGQGLLPMMLGVFAGSVFDADSPIVLWVWAYLVATYQIAQFLRSKRTSVIGLGWIAVVLTVALWVQTPHPSLDLRVTLALGIAAGLYCVAIGYERAFLATLALLLGALPVVTVMTRSTDAFTFPVFLNGALSFWFLLLTALTRPAPEKSPWTRGFLRAEQATWLKGFFLAAVAQLLRIPVFGTLFDWARRIFTWLNYVAGGGKGLTFADLIFAAANFIGPLFVSNQIAALLATPGKPDLNAGLRLLAVTAVFIPWGLAVVMSGTTRRDLFYRVVGTALTAFPIVAQLTYIGSANHTAISLLIVSTGLGMWLAASAARRPRTEVPIPSSADNELLADG